MQQVRISFITTVRNEEKTIGKFLDSIYGGTKLPDEIVIVDASVNDKTEKEIENYKKNRKDGFKIKLFTAKHVNRSVGRNKAIVHAKGEIIVCSDSGCILDKNFIESIVKPFSDQRVDVVSGFYQPITEGAFQKCLAAYTCVMPDKVDSKYYLPSSRSIAFRKSVWQRVGGYPKYLNTCEDLVFAKKMKKFGANFVFQKNAFVLWPQRKNLVQAFQQFYGYAIGDGIARYFRMQTPLLYIRYIIGIFIVILAILLKSKFLLYTLIIALLLYIFWSITKNYRYVKNAKGMIYLPVLQFTADIAVLTGMSVGLIKSLWVTRNRH
jgi:glycosyltransferase involved in cell wall biosynthesis